jgi:hypothetical protein
LWQTLVQRQEGGTRMITIEERIEKEAIATGLAILDSEYDGDSNFDKGMRLLQELLKAKRKSE